MQALIEVIEDVLVIGKYNNMVPPSYIQITTKSIKNMDFIEQSCQMKVL